MSSLTYQRRRGQLETYFDRTAVDAWAKLTSDVPLGSIRATVRAGRDRMRATLLGFLPTDLDGTRLLDAGCGTGALAIEAARRGAQVTAIDLSPTLIRLAQERAPAIAGAGSVQFGVCDMSDAALGSFDYVIAMDSLIHYRSADVVRVLSGMAARTRRAMAFTFAPRTPALSVMHAVGRCFPRSDRAPAIEPVSEPGLRRQLSAEPRLAGWRIGQTQRISSAFYKSQAMQLLRS
jgi:magnesium-protoporphyrin O-methyltransferase